MGDTLSDLELTAATELEKKRVRVRYPQGGKTRIARDVRAGKRKKPPVPKNKSVSEIAEMDPHDPAFRHKSGKPRKYEDIDGTPLIPEEELSWMDLVRRDKQRRHNDRRARTRKGEAKIIAAVRELETHVTTEQKAMDIYDEEKLIAEQILDFDDWDDEELIRGYRRGRKGNFGKPPKYIPREVQQAAFRLLIGRGDRRMKEAYPKAIEALIDLAHNADSEKVRLEAVKELMNRVVGKVPDTMLVAREAPWEGVLAESVVPISDVPPLEMDMDDDGVARLPYLPDLGAPDEGVGVTRPEVLAAEPTVEAPSTPSKPRRRASDDARSPAKTAQAAKKPLTAAQKRAKIAKARKKKT